MDPVTTTDEAIPSRREQLVSLQSARLGGVHALARDPEYVGRSSASTRWRSAAWRGRASSRPTPSLAVVFAALNGAGVDADASRVEYGSMIYAKKPGDGSAREQAASCQRVIGGLANIVEEYATKRYRSNVMNWGMVPFQLQGRPAV